MINYPKLNRRKIEESIKRIDNLDLEIVEFSYLVNLINDMTLGYKVNVPFFSSGQYLYRSRVCNTKPSKYSDLIYPREDLLTTYGRANGVGKPVFYAAFNKVATLAEVGTKVGDFIVISSWVNKQNIILNHVGFTQETISLLNSERPLHEIYDFTKQTQNFDDLNKFLHNYLASKFIGKISEHETYKYKLSAAIARGLNGDMFDGILYPSVALSGNADNIALNKECADEKIELVSVEYFEVTNLDDKEYKLEALDTATEIDSEGNIMWSGKLLTYTFEGGFSYKNTPGEHEVRDIKGGIVLPKCNGDIIGTLSKALNAFKSAINDGYKISRDCQYERGSSVFELKITEVFMLIEKTKHVAFYLPVCDNQNEVLKVLINNYDKLFEPNEMTLKDNEGNIIISLGDFETINKIEVYSETQLDEISIKNSFRDFCFLFYYNHSFS